MLPIAIDRRLCDSELLWLNQIEIHPNQNPYNVEQIHKDFTVHFSNKSHLVYGNKSICVRPKVIVKTHKTFESFFVIENLKFTFCAQPSGM